MSDLSMYGVDPFNREAAAQAEAEQQAEEQFVQQLEEGKRQAVLHAVMALVFFDTLAAKLGEEKALYLTAQIWRSS